MKYKRGILFIFFVCYVISSRADILDSIFRRISGTEEREAMILARKGEYEKAREILEPLYLKNPKEANIASKYIWLTLRIGKKKEALNIYENFPNKAEISEEVKKELFDFKCHLLHEEAVRLARIGKHDDALNLIDECLKYCPGDVLYLADKIIILLWKGDNELAFDVYKKSFEGKDAKKAPKFLREQIEVFSQKLEKEHAIEQKDEKKEDYKKGEKIFVEQEELYKEIESVKRDEISDDESILKDHSLAIEYARAGKYEKALEILSALLKKSSAYKDKILSDYIVVLSWYGKHLAAVEVFEKESGNFKEEAYLYRNIAFSYRQLGRMKEAITFYQKALENLPDDLVAIEGLAFAIFAEFGVEGARNFLEGEVQKGQLSPDLKEKLQENLDIIMLEKLQEKQERDALSAKIAYAEELVRLRDAEKLLKVVEDLIKQEPENPNVLILKVYYYQLIKEYFKAYEFNEAIINTHPDFMSALNTRYHILLDLGAAQCAKEKLEEGNNRASLAVKKRILGDLAAQKINFLSPKEALKSLDYNIKFAEEKLKDVEEHEDYERFKNRTEFDRFLALRQMEEMEQIIKDYEELKESVKDFPEWVLQSVGDAYLYLRKPKKALELYEEVHRILKLKGQDKYPYNYNLLLAKNAALIELERHDEAMQILDDLEAQLPYFARPNGVFQENWDKVQVQTEKAWNLIFDDRLSEAEEYLEKLILSMPFNSNPKLAQAYLHLYRDFPRLALEDFEIVTNLAPESRAAVIGKAYALNYNDRSEEGREIAKKLLEEFPRDTAVIKLNRHFEIQDMRLLSVKANFSHEGSFVDGAGYTIRLDQPIYPWRKVYLETLWLQTKDNFKKRNIFRSGAGFDWRINRDFTLYGAFSLDHQGDEPGFMGGLKWEVDDHLTLSGTYNSYSLNLPPKALLYKYKGQEAKFNLTYRFSEDLITEFGFSNIWLSDANTNQNYNFRIDKGLTYSARWKTRVAVEGYSSMNTKYRNRGYFAPRYSGALYFVPMIEHMWYRRYDFSIFDRFYFGIGPHWEKGYNPVCVWYIRYEQEWKITDTLSFKIGGKYGRSRYGNEKPYGWNFYTEFYWHF